MKTELLKFDIAEHLTDEKAVAEYLEACLEEGGVPLFLKGIGDAARARGMKEIAERAGVTRASLYKSLSEDGSPAFATIEKVISSLGLRISLEPVSVPQVLVVRTKKLDQSHEINIGKIPGTFHPQKERLFGNDPSPGRTVGIKLKDQLARDTKTSQFHAGVKKNSGSSKTATRSPTRKK